MTVTQIPDGTRVFLDSNVLVHAIARRSVQCCALLDRCSREEVCGLICTEVIHEITHKLMLVEAANNGLIAEERASLLSGKPDTVRSLRWYWEEVTGLLDSAVLALQYEPPDLEMAQRIRERYGLMTRDSLMVSAMMRYRITSLATNDRVFERVGGIQVYRPMDL